MMIQGIMQGSVQRSRQHAQSRARRLYRDLSSGAYHDVSRHEGLEPIPGLGMVRVDGPLFFADADRFRERLHELARAERHPACLVVDASAVHLTDTDGADILIQIEEELRARGTTLVLAGVHPPVLALWGTCRADRGGG
jgi:SulP family sulfate permease